MSMRHSGGVRPHAHTTAIRLGLVAVALFVLVAPRAGAFDFQDGRLQIHGYFEEQIRALSHDLSWEDDIDLAQWYNVLSVETEYDFAPDGFGPFDILSGFARIEVRYDCVWTRGCGMFPSVNMIGNRAEHLPNYKTSGHRTGMSGSLSIADQRAGHSDPDGAGPLKARGSRIEESTARFTSLRYRPTFDNRDRINDAAYHRENVQRPMFIDQLDGFTGLFGINGSNGIFEASGDVSRPSPDTSDIDNDGDTTELVIRNDDPAYFYFSRQSKCIFGSRYVPGGANGVSNQILGPLNPRCKIDPNGAMIDKPNPFNPEDINPIIFAGGRLNGGSGELPGRPASLLPRTAGSKDATSQGVYYPSPNYQRFLRSGKSSIFDQNFGQQELAWNRGGSQQDEKEFKEGYLDMEFFDSRLWVRAGKQNIVWGKTELFRTTDQFNPTDVALASLASLEETRIALWSVRSVWSFYDVGPLEDLRLELAVNLDDVEPADIGRCGEAYTVLVACNKTTALWAHGLFGVALAGENRPDSWWKDSQGLEYGGRLEFRLGRFSFQISDFYGYEDFPFVNRLSSFENRKDPETGRPLRIGATGRCRTGNESSCLPLRSNVADDGSLAFSEDFDGDNRLDVGEDANGNGVLDPDEDQDLDGVLDVNEDLNGDGSFQTGPTPLSAGCDPSSDPTCNGEDIDLDGHFDVGETNANGDTVSGDDFDSNGTGSIDAFEIGDTDGDGVIESGAADASNRANVLANQSANMQIFAAICATSIGFNSNDTRACGQSVFNSKTFLIQLGSGTDIDSRTRKSAVSIAALLSNTLTGNGATISLVRNNFTNNGLAGAGTDQPTSAVPYVQLNQDPCDGQLSDGDGTCDSARPGREDTGYTQFSAAGTRNSLNEVLSDEQESMLGCGPFWGTDCEADGLDLLNAEASVLMQSFPGFEGDYGSRVARNGFRGYCIGCDVNGNAPGSVNYDPTRIMPVAGTIGFNGATPGTRYIVDEDRVIQLPGARGPYRRNGSLNLAYNALQDGCIGPDPAVAGCNAGDSGRAADANRLQVPLINTGVAVASPLYQPFDFGGAAGLQFSSEMAALSWNLLMTLVAFSQTPRSEIPNPNENPAEPTDDFLAGPRDQPDDNQLDVFNPMRTGPGLCSYAQPQYCSAIQSFFAISGAQRKAVKAGGTGEFGRRDFQWHAGGEGVLDYQKRNVFGISADFAEDVTKSNWGVEATWISNVRFTDNNSFAGVNTGDTFNLTVSVDRPTFINFLNPNRTFFFNSQVFFQYISNYQSGFTANGPFNVLGTFTVQTGYFQDRLLPGVTFVYDVNSNSGAALPSITYRFTEAFSATIGVNFFWGRFEFEDSPVAPLGTIGSEVGNLAYRDGVENALSVVRERDELFLRIRFTF